MKLTQKGNITQTDKIKYTENEIYKTFQTVYNEVFENVPEIENNQCEINNRCFKYNKSEKEKLFYEYKYTNLRKKCINLDTLGLAIPNEIKHYFGNAKRDLLDFTYNLDNEIAAKFEGDRGFGKTTILRFVFFHIIPKLNEINEKKVVPIYVSFNKIVNDLNQEQINDNIITTFYNVLSDRIRNYYIDILSDTENDFYKNYLMSKDGFSEYKIKLKKINQKINSSKEKEKDKDEIYNELLKSKDAILHCFAYATKFRDNSIPIIILDDLDPLDTNIVRLIFNEIYNITRSFKIKIIYTIRPLTAKKINRIADFTGILQIELTKPELLDFYLEKCLTIFIDKIGNRNITQIRFDNLTFTVGDAQKFFKNFLAILKQERSRDLLENLADGDIRLYKELVKTCLSSGLIKSEELVGKLLADNFDVNKSIPYWIVYSSIITQNHKLIFPEVKVHNNEHIINLLCNGGEIYHKYLMRLHLLSYFINKGYAEKSYKEIKSVFESIFVKKDYDNLNKSLDRAIRKLNNSHIDIEKRKRSGLIHNEDKLFITDGDNGHENYVFRISEVGRYYYNKLITTFEYLSFMKDDVDFPNDIADTIQNNIETKSHQGRFNEVIKYINFLFEEEKKFLNAFRTKQKLQIYKDNLSPFNTFNKLLFSELFAYSMKIYGESRIAIFDNAEIENLIKKINLYLVRKNI